MLAYLAVPVKLLSSRYGMCSPLLGSQYLFAKPKSIIYTCRKMVINKLSYGSLTKRFVRDSYSTRLGLAADQKIFGFDIPMNEICIVQILHTMQLKSDERKYSCVAKERGMGGEDEHLVCTH